MRVNKKKISCAVEIEKRLEEIIRCKTAQKRMYDRAKIILLHLAGNNNQAIAKELKIRPHTVGKWVNRFAKAGIDGLQDSPRPGRPKKYNEPERQKILQTISEKPPKGQSTWDGNSVAQATGFPAHAVWGILRKDGIHLSRTRSWCISNDKNFTEKAADIVGLYINPPANAIIFSVDEKPSIQALKRKQGYAKTSNGKIVRGEQSTYKRNGVTNLIAVLEIATGRVITKMTTEKKRKDFLAFMDGLVSNLPTNQEIHVILDNYCTHKNNDAWLSEHSNVKFHFTPTSASWLNMVEIWFGMLTRKVLKGGSFESIDELCSVINDYVEVYSQTAKPFKWRKREVKGAQLRNTVANLII